MKDEIITDSLIVKSCWNNTNNFGDDSFYDPWEAQISLDGWLVKQGGPTKEKAIANLYEFLNRAKKGHEEMIVKINKALSELKAIS